MTNPYPSDTAEATVPPHRDPAIVAAAGDALAYLADLSRSMVYAAVVTDDGFEVTHLPAQFSDNGRMASMASSVQALGEAVVRELQLGTGDSVIIAAERGHVIQRRVPGQTLVVAAQFDSAETLGKALSLSRLTAERLAAALGTPVTS